MSDFIKLLKAPFSVDSYYKALNLSLKKVNNEFTMLHYPFFVNENDSFLQSQKNLTDHCISFIGPIAGKEILEIGCGNGVQLIYLLEKYEPAFSTGIDLIHANISIADSEKQRKKIYNIHFEVNNSQDLRGLKDDSFDFVICIESALHYPDKQAFLSELRRVLKQDGKFIIADLILAKKKYSRLSRFFRKKLKLFHWTEEKYRDGFNQAGLKLIKTADITNDVIRGFKSYPMWLSQIKNGTYFDGFVHSVFYNFILRLFIYQLTYRRNYYIFSGTKN